ASSRPAVLMTYSPGHRVSSLGAVTAAASLSKPVHRDGHDWGSMQGWEAVATSRLSARIASFTSISGPSLDHAGRWLRRKLRAGRIGQLLRQMAGSWYIAAFDIPGAGRVVASLAPRRDLAPRTLRKR